MNLTADWRRDWRQILKLLHATATAWLADKAGRLGAALAFYSILSLAPLLLLILSAAGAIFGAHAARGQIVAQLHDLFGTQGAEVIQGIIKASAHHKNDDIIATLISLAVLFVGASSVFGQLQDALNTIWHVPPPKGSGVVNFIKKQLLAFVMVGGTGLLLVTSLAISMAIAVANKFAVGLLPQFAILFSIVNFIVGLIVTTALFAAIFKILPNIDIAWRDVWTGAIFTTALFIIGKVFIGLYLSHSGVTSSYGAAGSVLVILIWIYYSAQILLFGAEFTKIYAKTFGSHQTS